MEKIPFIFSPWSYLLIVLWLYNSPFVSCQYLDDQKSLLLQLKNNLTFGPDAVDKLEGWKQSTDCCQWSGVECDSSNGRVIGLDLSEKSIKGGIDNTNSLFRLQYLQRLNLAGNGMQGEIPSAFGKLSSLTYLNLSDGNFSGQVPIEISHLVKLVVLDLSKMSEDSDTNTLYMKRPNLATIIQNMTNMKELYLDGIDNSAMGNKWCEALSSWLPRLQVLSMSDCGLSGKIHKSLLNLQHLSVLRLDSNSLSGPVPEFLARFINLTTLSLRGSGLTGGLPGKIIQAPTVRVLDLAFNENLQGTLPSFYKNASLEVLRLSYTNFSGNLPSSISNLKRLRVLDLSYCQFQGSIPSSISSLNLLEQLDLSFNQFSGHIPSSISRLNLLEQLGLSSNQLSGPIPSSISSLNLLEQLDLSFNQFLGPIPLFSSAKNLTSLHLKGNKLNGSITAIDWGTLRNLVEIDLSNNSLEGPFPMSILQLRQLEHLDLSYNKFNGTLQLSDIFQSFQTLSLVDLSFNSWSINVDAFSVNSSLFQPNGYLGLASSNLSVIPEFIQNLSPLTELQLSMNNITGKMPRWMWDFRSFNLSSNHLVELEPPSTTSLSDSSAPHYVDIHSNNFQGKFPGLWASHILYLDCSNNNFTSIDPEMGNYMSEAIFISFANNNLHGSIPTSLCNATNLGYLNLEYNHLSGKIPECLIAMPQLMVFNLRENSVQGVIPAKFGISCSLKTLDLNGNKLQGQIPRSLSYCKALQVLDLGSNQFDDAFPCHLESLSDLSVLILRSNKFYGSMVCPESHSNWSSLQVLDLAFNHFSGELTPQILFKWTSMMVETNSPKKTLTGSPTVFPNKYYQNSVALTIKSNIFEVQSFVLAMYTVIDFSGNAFHGELPRELGKLNALKVLNLSRNSFTGNIPSSIGNLNNIETLDLSCNAFSGKIPAQLANLNFLEYLNLSFNKLSGKIPTGTQLQTFNATSYQGNQGLYGPPLTPIRHDPRTTIPTSPQGSNWSSESYIEWMLRGAEVGFPVGITIFLGPILYIKRYREWYCRLLHRIVMKIMRKEYSLARRTRRNKPEQRQRR